MVIRSWCWKFVICFAAYLQKNCYTPSVDQWDSFLCRAKKYFTKFYFGLYHSIKYWYTENSGWGLKDNKKVIDMVWKN